MHAWSYYYIAMEATSTAHVTDIITTDDIAHQTPTGTLICIYIALVITCDYSYKQMGKAIQVIQSVSQ